MNIEAYRALLDALDLIRDKAGTMATQMEGIDCSVTDMDANQVYYDYYFRSNTYTGSFPAQWLFVDDWEPLWKQAVEERKAEQARKKVEENAKALDEREQRERATYERLKAKYSVERPKEEGR